MTTGVELLEFRRLSGLPEIKGLAELDVWFESFDAGLTEGLTKVGYKFARDRDLQSVRTAAHALSKEARQKHRAFFVKHKGIMPYEDTNQLRGVLRAHRQAHEAYQRAGTVHKEGNPKKAARFDHVAGLHKIAHDKLKGTIPGDEIPFSHIHNQPKDDGALSSGW
jgi:hypothetical protein